LSFAGDTLYVADTNNHAIRTIDLRSKRVRTLDLSSVKPPDPPRRPPTFPNSMTFKAPEAKIAPGDRFKIEVTLQMPTGYHVNPDAPMPILIEAPNQQGVLADTVSPMGSRIKPPAEEFSTEVELSKQPRAGDKLSLRVSV